MKTLILILVVATTGLAVASVQFAWRASSETKRADAEMVLRQKQEIRIQQLERSQATLEQQAMQAQRAAPSEPAVARLAPPPPMGQRAVSSLTRVEPGQESQVATFGAIRRPFGVRGPMDSEAGRKYMQTQMRSNIRRLYGDVGRELNLSEERADALVNLMADQQTRFMGERREAALAEGADPRQAMRDLQAKNNKEIAALIGEDKMSELKQYQQTVPQRAEVDGIRQQMEQAGLPLSADQRSQLVEVMVDEIQRNPRPLMTQGLTPEEAQKQQLDWQTTYDKSVSERAKQVLSSEQYDRYHEYKEWMADMRRNLPLPTEVRAMRGGGQMNVITATGPPGILSGPVVTFQAMDAALVPPPPPPPPPK